MDIWAIFVDWHEATARAESGKLADDLVDELGEATWLDDAEFEGTFEEFTNVGRTYEALRPHAPPHLAEALSASLDRFLREAPEPWFELPDSLDLENHFLALGPTTVAEIAIALKGIDLDTLGQLYSDHCPADVRQDLGHSPGQFVQSLSAWVDLFKAANEQQRGVIVKVG